MQCSDLVCQFGFGTTVTVRGRTRSPVLPWGFPSGGTGTEGVPAAGGPPGRRRVAVPSRKAVGPSVGGWVCVCETRPRSRSLS